MIQAKTLLAALQRQQKALEADLRKQAEAVDEIQQPLKDEYANARKAERTADTYNAWLEAQITQAAVAWLLGCVFVRLCEDNRLIPTPLLSGPGDALRHAGDAMRDYYRAQPLHNARHYLQHCFETLASYPALKSLFDPAHNPLYRLWPSVDGAQTLVNFWQQRDPDTGELHHDFTDATLDTRFLGDLYQDLSEAARKRYALLQTPDFVEDFILERTLEPAVQTFGLDDLRMIDPTCGSGHFLLGSFSRLLSHWQQERPDLDARDHVQRALASVHGVDLNPFAVAIARFRLLIAALHACGIHRLADAPAWQFNVTAGDALLHGPRRGDGEIPLEDQAVAQRYGFAFAAEDLGEINRILGQHYHAVVGNPPYITVPDKALNALYRARYTTCYRKYSLGVPFTERFMQLAVPATDQQAAGYVGLITTNSFMKREFGKLLIKEYLPRQDLTHVIDTSGAYIPGHGTPTVILLARHKRPNQKTLRAVLGIRGEPSTPEVPADGLVWRSIIEFVDHPGSENDFVSSTDIERDRLAEHPWSLQGGAAPEVLKQFIGKSRLEKEIESIGFMCIAGEDDAFIFPAGRRIHASRFVGVGDELRDWSHKATLKIRFSYAQSENGSLRFVEPKLGSDLERMWMRRTTLKKRKMFGKQPEEAGKHWAELIYLDQPRALASQLITFAFVATHNHFVLDRGGKVFKQSAPVIKLPANASEDDHLGLLGLLNSSAACFWMKQVFHNKGDSTDSAGARVTGDPAFDTYEFAGTGLKSFPLPDSRPLDLSRKLDELATSRSQHLPDAIGDQFPLTRSQLDTHCTAAAGLLGQMIAAQEELDWWNYAAYGLIDTELTGDGEPPALQLGERAFEIVLARCMAAGEINTTWFKRHGSTPITAIPEHWPEDYRALVQRRIDAVEASPWIRLLERPEYKRRWNQPRWDDLEQAALHDWLADRLETQRYWPDTTMQSIGNLAHRAETDADWMAVARLYTGDAGFAVEPLVRKLVEQASVPAIAALRYKPSGLQKHADWRETWQKQRQEDAIDAEVAAANPQHDDESPEAWQARIATLQSERKQREVGDIPVPPKYAQKDFARGSYWSLRGKLDVPKERFFSVPAAGGDALYGWAGWHAADRVAALSAAYIHADTQAGWDADDLLPLLVAIHEHLPWVHQWHGDVVPDYGMSLGDFFDGWLHTELQRHGESTQTLEQWTP